jgi:hypothetical protein
LSVWREEWAGMCSSTTVPSTGRVRCSPKNHLLVIFDDVIPEPDAIFRIQIYRYQVPVP